MKDCSILKGYSDKEGKFAQMPGKREKKKGALMLQFLSKKFNPEQQYTEKEVNEILNTHHSFGDPATLRRLLFVNRLINRTIDGRNYCLPK